ncbi:MAG: ribonuclease J [Oscillospiraceae bacterium]|nr:ribonuclease J [Oscillospiraceae bacterium]
MQKKNNTTNKEKNGKPKAQQRSKAAQAPQSKQPKKQRSSRPTNGSAKKYRKSNELPVKIAFLGGLNEVGKNMTLYEYKDDMFLVDCGLSFPDPEMLGVDLVIPDFSYVERNADKIRGIIITHGHEDHIGGLAYLLKTVNIPVYGTKLTIGLIQGKLKEHGLLGSAKLNEIAPGDVITLGGFTVEAIHVNHSIPDAIALAIKCDCGTVVQTGDFKIDSTPIDGGMIDLSRFAQLGDEGVLCLLSDSTNAERPGYTESERKVGESFEVLFRKAGKSRIIVATFASNIHRVQQIINVASSLGRKVAIIGRSLENVVNISAQLGYLNIPENVMINADLINRYPAENMVIITTGSQGEPMSALSRMAFSDHRKVEICPNDYVIISATPIPGNEKTVGKVVNELLKLGAHVIYEKMYDVHVSGHACQEELKLMMGLVKPKYFIPVHGEQKHLRKHAALAEGMGISKDNIFIADNGYVAEITNKSIKSGAAVPAGRVFVDGYGVGDVGSVVLRDRKHLGQDGIIVVTASIDYETGQLIAGPEVVSRGFVYVKEAEELIEKARKVAENCLESCYYSNINDIGTIKSKLRDAVSHFVYEQTKRSPMILPIIMEV